MIRLKINKKNLNKFLNDLKYEDETELKVVFKSKYKEKFIEICLNKNLKTYFVGDKKGNPIAIGGVVENSNKDNIKIGQVWLLCTNNLKNNKYSLFKYVKTKIEEFKSDFDVLFNFIYKSNYKALIWLSLFGFKFVDTKNSDFKFFFYKKEGVNFDIRRFTY